MIVLILILAVIVYLALFPLTGGKDESLKGSLYKMLEEIYESLDEKENYNKPTKLKIVLSNDLTRTENKRTIHLVVRNKSGQMYDRNTINAILIHEFTHILSPEWLIDHHTDQFKALEQKLLESAIQLGYLNSTAIDVNYPCKPE